MARHRLSPAILAVFVISLCHVSARAQVEDDAVHRAAWAGQFERVRTLIEATPALITWRDDMKQFPIHLAARGGHPEIVAYLLEKGSPVNEQAYNGFTPLHLTSNGEVARLLLDAGADVNLRCVGGNALRRAAHDRKVQVVQALLDQGLQLDLAAAVDLGLINEVERILRDGPKAIEGDERSWPLLSAAGRGNLELVKLLLDHGVDVHQGLEPANAPGRSTALNSALVGGHEEVALFLLERGADPTVGGLKNEDSLFHYAISNSSPAVVRKMLEAGADPNALGGWPGWGQRPLTLAAEIGDADKVRLLLEFGAEIEPGEEGISPLFIAAAHNHLEVAQALLDAGAALDVWSAAALGRHDDVMAMLNADAALLDAPDSYVQRTPLAWAIAHRHDELGRALIERGADVNARSNATPESLTWLLHVYSEDEPGHAEIGETPLHIAVHTGNLELVELLLETGADINARETDFHDEGPGLTPLHRATMAGRADLVTLLLDRGADIDVSVAYLGTPLEAAIEHPEVVRLLLARGARFPAGDDRHGDVFYDLTKDDAEVMDLALAHGAQMDLWAAVRLNKPDIVREHLVRHPDDVNAVSDGYPRGSVLEIAISNGNRQVVELLIERGADVNFVDEGGLSPLYAAAETGDIGMVHLLLEHGAVDHVDDYPGSAVFGAARSGNVEIMMLLVQHGANLHDRALGPKTLLHSAAAWNSPKVIDYLLEQGFDINLDARGDDGSRPIHSAAWALAEDSLRLLLERGADVRAEDYHGRTAMDILHFPRNLHPSKSREELEARRVVRDRMIAMLRDHLGSE